MNAESMTSNILISLHRRYIMFFDPIIHCPSSVPTPYEFSINAQRSGCLSLFIVLTDDSVNYISATSAWHPVVTGHGRDESPMHLTSADVKLIGDTKFPRMPRPTSVSRSPTCMAAAAVRLNGQSQHLHCTDTAAASAVVADLHVTWH